MRRRTKTRFLLKWAGTLLCAAIGLYYLFAGYLLLWVPSSGEYRLTVYAGRFSLSWMKPGWGSFGSAGHRGWQIERYSYRVRFWPPFKLHLTGNYRGCMFTLWVPFLGLLFPTASLWYCDRHPRGHCRNSGYNLTGNVSGVCPECGKAV